MNYHMPQCSHFILLVALPLHRCSHCLRPPRLEQSKSPSNVVRTCPQRYKVARVILTITSTYKVKKSQRVADRELLKIDRYNIATVFSGLVVSPRALRRSMSSLS